MKRIEGTKHLEKLSEELRQLISSADEVMTYLRDTYTRREEVTDLSKDFCEESTEPILKLSQHIDTLRKDAEQRRDLPQTTESERAMFEQLTDEQLNLLDNALFYYRTHGILGSREYVLVFDVRHLIEKEIEKRNRERKEHAH